MLFLYLSVTLLNCLLLTEKTTNLQEPVNPDLLNSMQTMGTSTLQGTQRPTQINDSVPRIAPKWLKHDRQVLNFTVFFQESVVENANENYRLRKCTMYYYLEDDTIHILETRVPNSGIPQGIFLKRHLVPKVNSIESYTWKDLAVGADIEFYGRFFRLIDADEFTRAFYANEGITQAPAESFPDDPFLATRAMVGFR